MNVVVDALSKKPTLSLMHVPNVWKSQLRLLNTPITNLHVKCWMGWYMMMHTRSLMRSFITRIEYFWCIIKVEDKDSRIFT